MSVLGGILVASAMFWISAGGLGLVFPTVLRRLILSFSTETPSFLRRLVFATLSMIQLLFLVELAINYQQPTTVGDMGILVISVFFFILFMYFFSLSRQKFRNSPLITVWKEKVTDILFRFISLAMILLGCWGFYTSGQY